MRLNFRIIGSIMLLFITGCVAASIDNSIRQHADLSPQIQLGDSLDKVQNLLEPLQLQMLPRARKPPEQFLKDGNAIFILYARSSRQPDGLTTDDEFTPYIFENGKLIAIGWTMLGGPKTQGQATSDTYINVQQTVK